MDPEKSTTQNSMARRASVMTIEAPLSPVSSNSDTLSIASRPSRYSRSSRSSRHSQDFADSDLQRHLSHTSSTNAVGGVVPTILDRSWTQNTAGTTGTQDLAFEIDFEDGDKVMFQAASRRHGKQLTSQRAIPRTGRYGTKPSSS